MPDSTDFYSIPANRPADIDPASIGPRPKPGPEPICIHADKDLAGIEGMPPDQLVSTITRTWTNADAARCRRCPTCSYKPGTELGIGACTIRVQPPIPCSQARGYPQSVPEMN